MGLKVIDYSPENASSNMRIDREIIEMVSGDLEYAVLRWYGWQPPAFSLGYGQKPEKVFDFKKLDLLGIDYVKRPTGGSLVYHNINNAIEVILIARL